MYIDDVEEEDRETEPIEDLDNHIVSNMMA